MIVFIES